MLTAIKKMLAAPSAPAFTAQDLEELLAPQQRAPATFKLSRGPLDQFMYPDESTLDDWGKLHTRKLKAEITERYTRYQSFDICCVRDYVKEMRIPLTSDTKLSLECLQQLHCVKFDLVPTSIFERIPHWFNHVISCGQIKHPLIAEAALDSVIDV